MITHTRKGSRICINVNGDWSGDAIVSVSVVDGAMSQHTEIPAMDLLLGKIGERLRRDLATELWCEAISIAVEAYMTDRARLLLDDLHIARTGVASTRRDG